MGQIFADYDFESEYDKQIEKIEEWETEKIFRKNKLGCLYMTRTTKAGNQIELDIYPAFRSRHDLPRGERKNRTKKAMRNLNQRRAERKLTEIINANFTEKDLWCTWTYKDGFLPASIEEAQEKFRKFIRRVNNWRKRRGLGNVKYVVVTEFHEDPDKGIRVHHHALMSGDMDRDSLEILWKYGKRNQTRRLDPDDFGLSGIASYISKDPQGRKRWSTSRNLKKPKVTHALGKFSKRRVEKMAKDHAYLQEQIEKRYPEYRFLDAKVCVNEINSGFYVYARMVRRT